MDLNSVLFFLVTILVLVVYLIRKRLNFWSGQGVPTLPAIFPYGNFKGVTTEMTLGEKIREHYMELKGQGVIGGLYASVQPVALILDLDLLRSIFIKDFQYFQNRGIYVNEKADPLSAHLFAIEGEKWRNMRSKLSPTFTSGKMKMMHSTFLLVAEQFKDHLMPIAEKKQEVEIKDILARYTTDIIANVAFGVECNSLKDPDNEFRATGMRVLEKASFLKRLLLITFPKIGLAFNLKITASDISDFFMNLVRETVTYRESHDVKRNDFMSLLLQIKNHGKVEGESSDLGGLTLEEIAAQTFLFFFAGFETSSSTMSFAVYELALNQEMQDKARHEIFEALERHDGKLTYEAAAELTYLDQIIQETLRKYPIVPQLIRKVTADYKVPDTKVVLKKGLSVFVPIYGIHHDPEIYPEPEKFDPKRFTKENIASRHHMAWLPFGEGPRNCIGMRFGLLQSKVGLATILSNFRIIPSEHNEIPLKMDPGSPVLSAKGGMFIRLELI